MKIDLCKIFGVAEGEEFKIEHKDYGEFVYTVIDNILWAKSKYATDFSRSSLNINIFDEITGITKLPKKKEFTDDELAIMRGISKDFKWMARDKNNSLYLYTIEPTLNERKNAWVNGEDMYSLRIYEHLFNSIQWEDEEPVFIDDYVER